MMFTFATVCRLWSIAFPITGWQPVHNISFQTTVTHPEVESVPGLFLRIDAVGFGPADGPDVGLMALFEIDELEEDGRAMTKKFVM